MVTYGLRLNPEFRPYLDIEFGKKSKSAPTRQLKDETRSTTTEDGRVLTRIAETAAEKCVTVDLLLETIANFACPYVPRNDIVKDSKSLKEVWAKIKLQYNQQQSGALLNECWEIKRNPDESPQVLYSRLKQAYDECLLTQDGLNHIDGPVTEDEEMSPTLHNTIILQWMEILHPRLRQAVTQKFITQLRNQTYASLYPEISRSVEAILEELDNEASVSRLQHPRSFSQYKPNSYRYPSSSSSYKFPPRNKNSKPKIFCNFCKLTGRSYYENHSDEDCLFIKKYSQKLASSQKSAAANCLNNEDDEDYNNLSQHYEDFYRCEEESQDNNACTIEHIISRISMDASPVLTLMKNQKCYNVTLDSGATCNCLDKATAREMNAIIQPTNHRVRMADGLSYLPVVGETTVTLYRNNIPLQLSAVVCEKLDTDILAGMEFMRTNDIGIRPAYNEISIGGTDIVNYDPIRKPGGKARRLTYHTIKSNSHKIILPGEEITFPVPPEFTGTCAIEPRYDTDHNTKLPEHIWPSPQIVPIRESTICLSNPLKEAVIIKKLEHVCKVLPEASPESVCSTVLDPTPTKPSPVKPKNYQFSSNVILNPNHILSKIDEIDINNILRSYDTVFDPKPSTYNGKSGPCLVEVNIGKNLPPQRKGRLPFYGKNDMNELQQKFDELTTAGILSRPQDIGVTIENTNPSFLVKKQPPSTEKRLVTDFSSIADYCRPTPTVMPNVESTLRTIASWNIIGKTDMSAAYFQLEMKKSSKKYCGVHTPFKGLRVYNTGVMGLPGVEVALEELTSLVLGDMVTEGKVAKLADDLFIGASNPAEFKQNLKEVLIRLHENNIKLKATKTILAPKEVVILGWIWSNGKLRASSHRLLVLSICKPPETVTAMKSFLGSYRFLSRTIRGYANLLKPLEESIKGKDPKLRIEWTDDLSQSFTVAQKALTASKSITIPRPEDPLIIVTDASVKPGAVGSILYAIRDGVPCLAEFYNSKLPDFQARWLPCEVEALAIAVSLYHFAPYLIQSKHKPQVVTDSKSCVDAAGMLHQGKFSTSPRLSAYLSSVGRFQAIIKHQAGTMNLPADYLSRHPLLCDHPDCTICKFVGDTTESVVQKITIEDITEGRVVMPFANRNTWRSIQDDCSDLRKVKQFRKNGTIPSRKARHLKEVRRYLSAGVLLAHDEILVYPHTAPMRRPTERIVVPQKILHGILTALHLKFNHPSSYQLSKVFCLSFFGLNLDKAAHKVSQNCHQCASLKEVPKTMIKQTTDAPPNTVTAKLSADIMKRNNQKIIILREVVSSYTMAKIIPNETSDSVSEALMEFCNFLRPDKTANVCIKVDPAPAHKSLFKKTSQNSILKKHNINLELGRASNPNKNPIIDKCIKEIINEIQIISPDGGPISPALLSIAVANLNSRYRRNGLSSHEIFTQRDQVTGEQLPISDRELIIQQQKDRMKNHQFSETAKARGKHYRPSANVSIGSLVYLYSDKNKLKARPRYLVTNMSSEWLTIRRFSQSQLSEEYKIRRDECYTIPHIDNNILTNYSNDESSDEETFYPSTHKHNNSSNTRSQQSIDESNEEDEITQQETEQTEPEEVIEDVSDSDTENQPQDASDLTYYPDDDNSDSEEPPPQPLSTTRERRCNIKKPCRLGY